MHSVGRNNPCGAKEQDRDASDRGKVIPVEQKSGTGLNLVGADSVIHFDPWWNTATENQASDRAHRIGQTKVVTVYKLVAKGSIEERILALQQQKAKLAQDVLSGEGVGSAVLSREDLMEILGGESHLSAER